MAAELAGLRPAFDRPRERRRPCRPRRSRRPRTPSRNIRTIVARGGWNTVPGGPGAAPRLEGPRRAGAAPAARRLRRSRRRRRHGADLRFLRRGRRSSASRSATASGRPASSTSDTLKELNVSAEERLRELQINIVRLRSYSGDLGERFVMVNLPAAVGGDGRGRPGLFRTTAPASAASTGSRRSCRPRRSRSISTRSGTCRRRSSRRT